MTFQEVLTAINTVGFPIVACCCIAYFFAKTNDNYRNDLKEQNAAHKEETKQLTEAINRNTIVMEKLLTKLDHEEISK